MFFLEKTSFGTNDISENVVDILNLLVKEKEKIVQMDLQFLMNDEIKCYDKQTKSSKSEL